MARHRGTVLVDVNVILEGHRTGSWRALTGGYTAETAEDCVTETQTGFQRRQPEHRIDWGVLPAGLAGVRAVGGLEPLDTGKRKGAVALHPEVQLRRGRPIARGRQNSNVCNFLSTRIACILCRMRLMLRRIECPH